MRKFLKFILRPFIRTFYSISKEIINEEFELSGINKKNYFTFLNKSASIDESVLLMKNIIIQNESYDRNKMTVGKNSKIGTNAHFIIYPESKGIFIGEDSLVNTNCNIYSLEKISIGNRVLISYNVSIFDNNSHPLKMEDRAKHIQNPKDNSKVERSEVTIEDDVWVGCDVVILKGVSIGKGSIVAAGSIVTTSIPSFSVVAGNPAKVIKSIT
jgi:hypothetical protein